MHAKLQIAISRFMASFIFHKKNLDAVYTGADPGFLEGGFKFTKGVRFVKSSCNVVIRSRTVVIRGES